MYEYSPWEGWRDSAWNGLVYEYNPWEGLVLSRWKGLVYEYTVPGKVGVIASGMG